MTNLLAIYKPESIRQLQRNLNSVTDLIKPENNTPSISYLKNKVNELTTVTLIKLHLVELNDYLNLSRGLTGPQIDQTAEMILDEFPLMKIADLIYIFKQAKMGKFGTLYESLDGAKILSWFRQVWDERLTAAEYQSEKAHESNKLDIEKIVGTERASGNTKTRDLIAKTKKWLNTPDGQKLSESLKKD